MPSLTWLCVVGGGLGFFTTLIPTGGRSQPSTISASTTGDRAGTDIGGDASSNAVACPPPLMISSGDGDDELIY